jgi:hypothetical protein
MYWVTVDEARRSRVGCQRTSYLVCNMSEHLRSERIVKKEDVLVGRWLVRRRIGESVLNGPPICSTIRLQVLLEKGDQTFGKLDPDHSFESKTVCNEQHAALATAVVNQRPVPRRQAAERPAEMPDSSRFVLVGFGPIQPVDAEPIPANRSPRPDTVGPVERSVLYEVPNRLRISYQTTPTNRVRRYLIGVII